MSIGDWIRDVGEQVETFWDRITGQRDSSRPASRPGPDHLTDRRAPYSARAGYDESRDAVRPEPETPPEPTLPQQVGGKATRYGLVRAILAKKGVARPILDSARAAGVQAVRSGILTRANDLRLADPVTRAEAAVMVTRAFSVSPLPAGEVKRVFKDLPSFHWAGPAVYGAVAVGVISGFDDETFRPGETLDFAHTEGFVAKAAAPPGAPTAFDPRAEWGERSILPGTATVSGRQYANSLDTANHTTRDGGADRTGRVAATNAIVDELNASASARYQPGNGTTYCNVFAHDYAYLMGAFLPRVWWNGAALRQHERTGKFPKPIYGETTYELGVAGLDNWLKSHGHGYGWSQIGTPDTAGLTRAQELANEGRVVVIVGDRAGNGHGHITGVVPETATVTAGRNDAGQVTNPVQSQSGAAPETRGRDDWFRTNRYEGGLSIWAHG